MVLKKYMIEQFAKVKNKEITITALSKLLNCSRQWISNLYQRYLRNEPLTYPKGHRKAIILPEIKNQLIKLYQEISYEHHGILYTPSMSILKEIALERICDFPDIHSETLRHLFKDQHKTLTNTHIRKYRKRFEASAVGALIQGDVSTHQWIPNHPVKFSLILFIDDKSRYVLYAKFIESDNLENHLIALKQIIALYGIPIALYYDNDSKYNYIRHQGITEDHVNEEKTALIPLALREIGISLINSKPYQPQGKGKVERKFLTFQKQLPFYLKLNHASNMDDANKILDEYILKHNQTVSKAIQETPENIFKNSRDVFIDINQKRLEEIENAFTRRHTRLVSNINEISFNGNNYLVPKYRKSSLANFKIEIRENPHKWIKLLYKNEILIKYDLPEKHHE